MTLLNFVLPLWLRQGEAVRATSQIRNDDSIVHSFYAVYTRLDADWVPVYTTYSVYLSPGEEYTWLDDLIDYMPNRDPTWYSVDIYHEGGWDSFAERTIRLMVDVGTSLTISLSPSKVMRNSTYNVSGRLTRNDNGAGVSSQPIEIKMNDATIATTTTNSNGNYSINLTSPDTPGDYAMRTYFPSGYQFSTFLNLRTLEIPLIVPAAAIIIGGGLIILYLRKR